MYIASPRLGFNSLFLIDFIVLNLMPTVQHYFFAQIYMSVLSSTWLKMIKKFQEVNGVE